ncbi:MAG: tetratricopeptide repeat protein, partial [Bacteroidia bacterium]
MKNFLLVFTLVLLAPFLKSQNDKQNRILDSLKQVVKSDMADSFKYAALINLSWYEYMKIDTDSAFKYAQIHYDLGIKNKDSVAAFDGQLNMGNAMLYKGEYEKALEYFEISKSIQLQISPYDNATAYINRGVCFRNLGNKGAAKNSYQTALQICEQNDVTSLLPKLYGNLANIYDNDGDYEKAIDFHLKSLRLKEENSDSTGMAITFMNLGTIYADLNNNEKSIDYYRKSIAFAKSESHLVLLAVANINLSNTLYNIKRIDEAFEALKEAEDAALKTGNKNHLSMIYDYYGSFYSELKENEKALTYLNKAFELYSEINYKAGIAQVLTNIATIQKDQNNLDEAITQYEKALAIYDSIENLNERRDVYKIIALAYKDIGNYEKAFYYFEKYTIFNDSILNNSNKNKVLEFEYQKKAIADSVKAAEETKLQTALLDAEKAKSTKRTQQNYFLIAGLAIALIFGIVLFNRNRITKRQNEIIAKQKEQLAELDLLKNDFFTNITHEFRTPLTVILGAASNIKNSNDAELIKRNGQRLLKLINQILELSKLEDGSLGINKKQIDAVAFTKYLTDSYKSLAMSQNKSLEFTSHVNEQFMDIDQDKYQTIIGNLVSNAVKFTPENGAIQIEANSDGQHLNISIKDSGEGIPEEELDRLFDRFYQVKGSKSQKIGSGVGLALTKELVLRFNGSIVVKNHQNGGAIFTVTLPIAQQAPKTDFKAIETSGSKKPSLQIEAELDKNDEKPILLLVEDEPDIQSFIKSTLANDYNIIMANNGEEGVAMAMEQVPDIILSDVMMPVKDGLELTDELKNDARTSHIPIALLTAKVDLESRLEGLKRGADVYLPKPFEKEELLLQLGNLQEQQKRVREHFGSIKTATKKTPIINEVIEIENEFITRLKETISANFENENFGIEELSKTIGMSRTQLHRKLKALTAKSASQFVNEFKVKKACELLLDPENNVSEVAYALGFTDPNYFTRVFTKIK